MPIGMKSGAVKKSFKNVRRVFLLILLVDFNCLTSCAKVKDKYGDVDMNGDEEGSSSSDESEDEDAKELNDNVEKEFFKALSLVKSRDALIYDKEKCRFFDNLEDKKASSNETEQEKNDEKKNKKAYHLKDLERDMILKKFVFGPSLI